MVDLQEPMSIGHQEVMASSSILAEYRTSSYYFNGPAKQCFCTKAFNTLKHSSTVFIKNSVYGQFVESASAPFPFFPLTKIHFIKFDLTAREFVGISGVGENSQPNRIDGFERTRTTETTLLGDLFGRELQKVMIYLRV
jgi:hypothetical protein